MIGKLIKLFFSKRDAEGKLGKAWWTSKTFIANTVALIGVWGANYKGVEMSAEVAGSFLVVLNYGMRLISSGTVGIVDIK